MAVFRKVDTSFWQDPFVLNLTPEEKYFYLYLMTNTKTSQCGIYEVPKKIMEVETGYNNETVDKLLNRFIEYGKIVYSSNTDEIMLVNWIKYNGSSSPKILARVTTELKEIKNKELVKRYISLSNAYGYKLDTASILYPYSIDTEPQEEKEEEKEEVEEEIYGGRRDVFDYYLSLDLIKHKKYTKAMDLAIKTAMANNGYTVDDCKTLLDRHKKAVEATKGSEYSIRARPLHEFFGQKAYQAKHLICADYEEGGKYYDLQRPRRKQGPKKQMDFNQFPQHEYTEDELDSLFEKIEMEEIDCG